MVVGEILLVAYLALPVAVLVWSARRPGPDAGGRPRSTATAWAWAALVITPICYVGAAAVCLVGEQALGYRAGSSPSVETAITAFAALSLIVPAVTGVILGAVGWRVSRRPSPLAAAIANGAVASLAVAISATPLTTAGEPGWAPAAGVVTSVVLWLVFLLVARPWNRIAQQPAPAPGTPAPDLEEPGTDPAPGSSARDPADRSA